MHYYGGGCGSLTVQFQVSPFSSAASLSLTHSHSEERFNFHSNHFPKGVSIFQTQSQDASHRRSKQCGTTE